MHPITVQSKNVDFKKVRSSGSANGLALDDGVELDDVAEVNGPSVYDAYSRPQKKLIPGLG